jgi:hypothetical protein
MGVKEPDGAPYVVVRRLAADGREHGSVMLSVTQDGRAIILLEDANGATRTYLT